MDTGMRRVSSVLVVVAGLSACARPNPLYGLPAATEGTTTDGAIATGSTTRSSAGTGRPDDGGDAAQTQAGDGASTTDPDPDPDDTGPKLDLSSMEPMSACCEPTFVLGCEDVDLEACVCDLDNFCCDTGWDEQCVDINIKNCGATCYYEGDCCAPSSGRGCGDDLVEACVCETRPQCCEDGWDINCVMIADSTCAMGCFTADNDCCFATPFEVGCNQEEVWTCVCPEDPFCCDVAWDAYCVGVALDCGHCMLPPIRSDCCEESPPGGCLDHALGPGVMNCVCEINDACCTGSWNLDCIQTAVDMCTLECG